MKLSKLSDKQKNYAFIVLAVAAVISVFLGMNLGPQQSVAVQSEIMSAPHSSVPVGNSSNDVSVNTNVTAIDTKPMSVTPAAKTVSNPVRVQAKAGWIVGDV